MTDKQKNLLEFLQSTNDPFMKLLVEGKPWGNVIYAQEEWQKSEEGLKQRAAQNAKRYEAQLEAVLRKPPTPSAVKHKERLVESLRETYVTLGRNPAEANAFLMAANVKAKAAKLNKTAKNKNNKSSTAKSPKKNKK